MSTNAATRTQHARSTTSAATHIKHILDAPASPASLWDNILPKRGTQIMPPTETRGIFIAWPLLGIIVTIAIVLITGLVGLEIQVSQLNTTLLLRDADTRAEMLAAKEKIAQLEVYIHSDREKLVRIETQLDNSTLPKRK